MDWLIPASNSTKASVATLPLVVEDLSDDVRMIVSFSLSLEL